MQWHYCWRCGENMPMLDEAEYRVVSELYGAAFKAIKAFREEFGLPLGEINLENRFKPVVDEYERMTGLRVTNANAIMHHRLAAFGPPCRDCGKPLRTPRASRCMECGAASPT